ncbi:vacuolar ATPase assembly integral membrane protein VMA21 isoform X2 [Bubalus bubalis]|uniref:vacuolar ATPase assembly integral membrane protein VMA21 isoform X2 n=1 Tax=Bubalus bubalis TaxID=89462 RepID=UPI001D10055F|nr:vacuolar ATPase assembly integral membrane protein VMA21 isoform X2 [Bubalus bubalis]
MLRGKSRLNVEWLGYSPGLLLERRPLLAGRTPRSPGRNESSLASTLKTLLFFTALMITVPIGLYFTTKSYVFEAPGERELVDMGGGLWGNVPLLADIGRKRK